MTIEYIIREFEPRDAQQVTDLYKVCLATAYMHKGQHVANLQNWFANSKLSEGGDMHDVWNFYMTGKHKARCFWVAEYNGEVVGCVGAMESTKYDDTYIELVRLAVSDTMRGKGVGSALTKAFETFGVSTGYANANLSTLLLMDMAVSLYNKHGYTIVEQVQVPVPDGVEGWGDIPIIVVHLTKALPVSSNVCNSSVNNSSAV